MTGTDNDTGAVRREELYNAAKDMNVAGRSKMTKAQLEQAVDR